MLKKILSLLLMAALLLTVAACSGSGSPAVLTYGESEITQAMYTYYVATYKGRYIQAYDDVTDSSEFWESEVSGGKTGEEIIKELIWGNVAQNLVAAEEFRKAGLRLYDEDIAAVDDYIQSMTDELASGSRKTLNGYLSEFGVNGEILREMLLMEQKAQLYYEYLYGEDGADAPDDDDRQAYFEENYVRFQQIYINNVEVYEKDEDGYYVQDENWEYVTRELTAEEKAAAQEKIDAVRAGLEAGEDIDELKEKYSDSKDYDKGYYFSATTSTDYITSVVSTAFGLEVGEWCYVEGAEDVGAFFIKRLPLEEGAYADEELSDFFGDFEELLTTEMFSEKIEGMFGEIVKDEEYLGAISVKDSPANYYFY